MPRSHHQSPAEDGEGSIRGLQKNNNTGVTLAQEQHRFFNDLKLVISNDRFEPYRKSYPQDEMAAFATYAWNVSLSESLSPAIHGLEVALRNGIHNAATAKFGTDSWFNGRLKLPEQERLEKLRHRIDPSGTRNLTASDFVSGLSLGFWVDLFKGRYEPVLWPSLLNQVFPYASFPRVTKRQMAREQLYLRLDRIRRLRNRVFHHEPIWHLADLSEQHELILEIIGWISPAMLAMTRLLDRFSSVYTRGAQPYATELESIAQNWTR